MSRDDFAQLRAAIRRLAEQRAGANDWPSNDLAEVTAEMGLHLFSREVVITWGSYGWTRASRPLVPWATTDPTEVGEHGTHTHLVTPTGFGPGTIVFVAFTLDRTHPVVLDIVEFPATG